MNPLLNLILLLGLLACSGQTEQRKTSAEPAPNVANTVVAPPSDQLGQQATIVADTVYYMTGPQQSHPPEGSFKANTVVTIQQDNGAYVLVSSSDGITGWVIADSLRRKSSERSDTKNSTRAL